MSVADQNGTADVSDKLDELRRFIDRRFAELSMEIHATVQLVDYSETSISERLDEMKKQISAVISAPSMHSRNSGLELEAVVQLTEAAANRIMEAAEGIGDWLSEITSDPAMQEKINEKVNTIFEACSFQDLTSQRIRRAIDHLHNVETMLTSISTDAPVTELREPLAELKGSGPDLLQASIDALLADF